MYREYRVSIPLIVYKADAPVTYFNYFRVPSSPGGIPARNARGERLLLFIGIIDILQSYRLKKKLEHTWKSMIHDGVSTIDISFVAPLTVLDPLVYFSFLFTEEI